MDGKQYAAKLQHPLGVTYNHIDGKVYVADTYNHKLKVIDIDASTVETLPIKQHKNPTQLQLLNEPAGLCFDSSGEIMIVSNTNNHQLLRVDMKSLIAEPFPLNFVTSSDSGETVTDGPLRSGLELIKPIPLKRCKQLNLLVSIILDDQLKFTSDAPQKWSINTANSALKSLNTKGSLTDGKFTLQLQRTDATKLNVPNENIKLDLSLSLCDARSCLMKRFSLVIGDDNSSLQSSLTTEESCIQIYISPNDIRL